MAPKRLSREQTQQLIEYVRERPYLYDVRDPDHADATMVANAWKAITEKMGLKDGGEFHHGEIKHMASWTPCVHPWCMNGISKSGLE